MKRKSFVTVGEMMNREADRLALDIADSTTSVCRTFPRGGV